MDLKKYKENCRVCLKTHTDSMKNIFAYCIEGCKESLVQNISSLFRVELHPHEAYPQFICRKCLTELENIILFKEDLQRNQDFLQGLFRSTYPEYVEKNCYSTNITRTNFINSNKHSLKIKSSPPKSVGINSYITDLLKKNDAEFVKVPRTFLEELSPTVYLNKIGSNVQCKEPPQVKQEEILLQDNSNLLSIHKEVPITMCNLCNKVLGSQHLLNVHYKQIHGHMFSTENNTTRISASSSQQSICKMEIIENSLHNSDDSILKSSLHEQPQKVCIKEEIDNTEDQKVSFPQLYVENQATFLRNFNLISTQDMERLQIKRETLDLHGDSLQRQFKTTKKKNLGPQKQLTFGFKPYVKPVVRRVKNVENKNILNRSLKFLERYGNRNLEPSFRTTRRKIYKNINPNIVQKDLIKGQKVSNAKIVKQPRYYQTTVKKKNDKCEITSNISNTYKLCDKPTTVKLNATQINDSKITNKNFKTNNIYEKNREKVKIKNDIQLSMQSVLSGNSDTSLSLQNVDSAADVKFRVKDNHPSPIANIKNITGNIRSIPTETSYHTIRNKKSLTNCGESQKPYANKISITDQGKPVITSPHPNTEKLFLRDKPQAKKRSIGEENTNISFKKSLGTFSNNIKLKLYRSGSLESQVKLEQDIWHCQNIEGDKGNKNFKCTDLEIKKECIEAELNAALLKPNTDKHSQLQKNNPFPLGTTKILQNVPTTKKLIKTENKMPLKENAKLDVVDNSDEINKVLIPESRSYKSLNHEPQASSLFTGNTEIKQEYNDQKFDLNERYEIDHSLGLKLRLRRRSFTENLNKVKYDTQVSEENLESLFLENVNCTEIKQEKYIPLNFNKSINTSASDLSNKSNLETIDSNPDKIVNLSLEDMEVQMLVLNNEKNICFDDDDVTIYMKSDRSRNGIKPEVLSNSGVFINNKHDNQCTSPMPLSLNNSSDSEFSKLVKRRGRPPKSCLAQKLIRSKSMCDNLNTGSIKQNVTVYMKRDRSKNCVKPDDLSNSAAFINIKHDNSQCTSPISLTLNNSSDSEFSKLVRRRGRPPKSCLAQNLIRSNSMCNICTRSKSASIKQTQKQI